MSTFCSHEEMCLVSSNTQTGCGTQAIDWLVWTGLTWAKRKLPSSLHHYHQPGLSTWRVWSTDSSHCHQILILPSVYLRRNRDSSIIPVGVALMPAETSLSTLRWHLSATSRLHSQNCRSLDVFCFSQDSRGCFVWTSQVISSYRNTQSIRSSTNNHGMVQNTPPSPFWCLVWTLIEAPDLYVHDLIN